MSARRFLAAMMAGFGAFMPKNAPQVSFYLPSLKHLAMLPPNLTIPIPRWTRRKMETERTKRRNCRT